MTNYRCIWNCDSSKIVDTQVLTKTLSDKNWKHV